MCMCVCVHDIIFVKLVDKLMLEYAVNLHVTRSHCRCGVVLGGTTVLPWNRGSFFHGTGTAKVTVLTTVVPQYHKYRDTTARYFRAITLLFARKFLCEKLVYCSLVIKDLVDKAKTFFSRPRT